jgi:hypothetical protein
MLVISPPHHSFIIAIATAVTAIAVSITCTKPRRHTTRMAHQTTAADIDALLNGIEQQLTSKPRYQLPPSATTSNGSTTAHLAPAYYGSSATGNSRQPPGTTSNTNYSSYSSSSSSTSATPASIEQSANQLHSDLHNAPPHVSKPQQPVAPRTTAVIGADSERLAAISTLDAMLNSAITPSTQQQQPYPNHSSYSTTSSTHTQMPSETQSSTTIHSIPPMASAQPIHTSAIDEITKLMASLGYAADTTHSL